MRIYGELAPLLEPDAVVIGDGGDFVSYAGKYIEPRQPGGWLDPGPYGCLGTGLGYAIAARIARPSAQVVLLLGDGAAGFSLMDVDTCVRHRLPVVMICGNNGIWGLEKHPMQALYGYDVAADLQPECRYDQVVAALGGAGELVTRPEEIAPALRRAFASGGAVPGQRGHRSADRLPAVDDGSLTDPRRYRPRPWPGTGRCRQAPVLPFRADHRLVALARAVGDEVKTSRLPSISVSSASISRGVADRLGLRCSSETAIPTVV